MQNTGCRKIKGLLFILFVFLGHAIHAQIAEERVIDSGGDEEFRAAANLSDGTYVFVGSSSVPLTNTAKSYLVHLDENLDFSASAFAVDYFNPGSERGVDVLVNDLDEIFVLSQASNGEIGAYDALLAKYQLVDGVLEQEWRNYIGSEAWDIAKSLFLFQNELYFAGTTYREGHENGNLWVCKVNDDGSLAEEWAFESEERNVLSDAYAFEDQVYLAFDRGPLGGADIGIRAFDLNWDPIWDWEQEAEDPIHYEAKNLDFDDINQLGLAYTRFNDPDYSNDNVLLRLDADGMELGRFQVELAGDQEAACFEWALDVGVNCAKTDATFGLGENGIYIERRINEGSWNNAHVFGGVEDDEAFDIIEDATGRFLVCGWTRSYGDLDKNAYVFRIPNTFIASEYTFENEVIEDNTIVASLDEAFQEQFGLYPNPAKEQVHFNPAFLGGTYRISDLSGRSFQEGRLDSANLSVSQLEDGMYLIQVFHGTQVFTTRLLIAR
jgi:hypothetical protein